MDNSGDKKGYTQVLAIQFGEKGKYNDLSSTVMYFSDLAFLRAPLGNSLFPVPPILLVARLTQFWLRSRQKNFQRFLSTERNRFDIG